ncbi:dihydrodipicolinate synthase family protein [Vibrio sp. SM6]|uniref:Dihydrodipicolinate synthase family protein n=1 Tax=Vibrio agarilyticus TaxID=2726741 RepID=A0A7X8YFR4_9VIBR|nr:dihydrodipicolinate synthase family protein [Vibrio agarilyticus]NLS11830.1 dihydrodipicolinate synthase family protein [Vibrio agarilyticus]
MFSGLSAYTLTPMDHQQIDEMHYRQVLQRLVGAQVDSISVLGFTGSYAYLSENERRRVTDIAVEEAQSLPVIVGISAQETQTTLNLAAHAKHVGAAGLMLTPMSYQHLNDEEVFGLYQAIANAVELPLIVYGNPAATQYEFSDNLYAKIASLPHVCCIKIPGMPLSDEENHARITQLKALLPSHVTLGISGDPYGAAGLNAGCSTWFSQFGGVFPAQALAITRAAQQGYAVEAVQHSQTLEPIWSLYKQFGSGLRVMATAAEILELVKAPSLPEPLQALSGRDKQALAQLLSELKLR